MVGQDHFEGKFQKIKFYSTFFMFSGFCPQTPLSRVGLERVWAIKVYKLILHIEKRKLFDPVGIQIHIYALSPGPVKVSALPKSLPLLTKPPSFSFLRGLSFKPCSSVISEADKGSGSRSISDPYTPITFPPIIRESCSLRDIYRRSSDSENRRR